jgi:hypothetical protein
MRTAFALLLAASGLSTSACAQDVPLGAAYANGYAGAPNFDQCWTNGWAGTFSVPYCGWYDGYFYPGSGAYMYGRDRQPHALTPDQQNHWAGQSPTLSNGLHSPGPARSPDAGGFAPAPGRNRAGFRGMRGNGHGFGGGGFGGGRGAGSGHGSGGGHSGR